MISFENVPSEVFEAIVYQQPYYCCTCRKWFKYPHANQHCPNCGHEADWDDQSEPCPECGEFVESEMICPDCGRDGGNGGLNHSDCCQREIEQRFGGTVIRWFAALAACEGMTTDHLAPGCVAKLVEALERIRDSQTINPDGWGHMTEGDMQQIAEQALAAMKGV